MTNRFPLLALTLFVVLLSLTGCYTPGSPRWVADLSDCASLSVGGGVGLAVDVKLGALTHPALGIAQKTWRVGHEYRYLTGTWEEAEIVAPIISIPSPIGHPLVSRFWVGTKGEVSWENADGWIGPMMSQEFRNSMWFGRFHHLGQIEVGVTLVAVGARVSINPPEMLDFLLGFAGEDIADDDDLGTRIQNGIDSHKAYEAEMNSTGTPKIVQDASSTDPARVYRVVWYCICQGGYPPRPPHDLPLTVDEWQQLRTDLLAWLSKKNQKELRDLSLGYVVATPDIPPIKENFTLPPLPDEKKTPQSH